MKFLNYMNLKENMEGEEGADQSSGTAEGTAEGTSDETTDETTDGTADGTADETSDETAEEVPVETALNDDFLKEKVFTLSNLYLLLFFIVIYIVAYFVLGMFTGQGASSREITFSYIIDLLLATVFIAAFIAFYFSLDEAKQDTFLKERWESVKNYIKDDYAWIYQLGYILILYTMIYIFRIPMKGGAKPVSIYVLETVGWLLFMLILAYMLFKVAFDVSLFDDFEKIFEIPDTTVPETPPEEETNEGVPPNESSENTAPVDDGPKKEVFNFSNNKYNYEDAQAICKAYGADIATYDQIEESYNNGGEWCNYGWSANQMAYFPTQKETWNKLQSTNKHKNACGRPGINGGYMANPNIKFGVNCYGVKPEAKKCNLDKLSTSGPHIPMTEEEKKMDEKVQYWKENGDQCLNMNSFNYNKWSKGN